MMTRRSGAFTLVELIIVVAIIAILSAIAVPNLLEAQTRSKVSRTKTDLRSASVAIESYAVDNNSYPANFELKSMSTPIAYVSNAFIPDLFAASNGSPYIGYLQAKATSDPGFLAGFGVTGTEPQRDVIASHLFFLFSNGPDRIDQALDSPQKTFNDIAGASGSDYGYFYDPTNGTISRGDLMRSGKYRQ